MSTSVTIYSNKNIDAIFAAAALATTLSRKNYRVFIEFLNNPDSEKLNIINSYAIDLTHANNIVIRNSIAIVHIPTKKLGLIYKYDNDGRYNVSMKLSNINSTLEVALEYVKTLNDNIRVPQEILRDLACIKSKDISKLTRLGRTIYYAYKWGAGKNDTLLSIYNYAYNLFTSKNTKVSSDLERNAKNYEYALSLINKVINEEKYTVFEDLATMVLSSNYVEDEFLKNNLQYLKVVANELLNNLCKKHKMALLVNENTNGYEIRLCINKNLNLDPDKIINNIPELLNLVNYSIYKSYITITFKNPEASTLDNVMKLCQTIISNSIQLIKSQSS
jgi:hypothetical protein